MKKKYSWLSLLLVVFVLVGCQSPVSEKTQGQELKKISVMLDWTPNTNHTGLYVAKEKGYYREQGLDVEILQSSEPGQAAQLTAADKVDFAVSYQEEVTNARAVDIPLVSLAAVIQHNTSGFASLKEALITRPQDLEGKSYGGWGSPAEQAVIKAVMQKDGADPLKVKLIDIGAADFFSVIGKQVDFTWIFYGWTGIEAEVRNVPIDIIMLKDFHPALDYYTPVLITSEKKIRENPDLVKRFMAATSKGYEDSIKAPEEAAEILLTNAPELNRDLVIKSQKWLGSQYQADAPQWGWQKDEVWSRYAEWMLENNLLAKKIEPAQAFTNEFLPKK